MMQGTAKVKVLLADRHLLVLEGLRRMLETDSEIEVVGAAMTGDEAITRACLLSPDVIVMDVEMPGTDGISATRQLGQRLPDAKVLITSFGEQLVQEAIEAGASGYLTKDSDTTEITTAVRQVSRGLCPIAPSVTRRMVTEFAEFKRNHQSPPMLTERETTVLRLIAEGRASSEIGAHLFLSVSTVKREVGRIFDKLGVNDRPHAVSEAMKRGLL